MRLCRTITLDHQLNLSHQMHPSRALDAMSSSLLVGPTTLSFYSYQIAALSTNDDLVDFLLPQDLLVTWSLFIVDDLEKKSLLAKRPARHALLLTGELIDGIFESFHSFDQTLRSVSVNEATGELVLDILFKKDSTAKKIIGSAMCNVCVIDSLLFVRGLELSSLQVRFVDGLLDVSPKFINLYAHVVKSSHASWL